MFAWLARFSHRLDHSRSSLICVTIKIHKYMFTLKSWLKVTIVVVVVTGNTLFSRWSNSARETKMIELNLRFIVLLTVWQSFPARKKVFCRFNYHLARCCEWSRHARVVSSFDFGWGTYFAVSSLFLFCSWLILMRVRLGLGTVRVL